MAQIPRGCAARAPLLLVAAMLSVWGAASGQLRYSIPEEKKKGSFVGNVALDLGMDPQELSEGGARIMSRGRKQYFTLNVNTGHLYINERIDREALCAQLTQCLLKVEILSENIMKVYALEVEIQDINDNSPTFVVDQITLPIIENTSPGTRFKLPEAHDADMGVNSLQSYQLSANKHFTLDVKNRTDGRKSAALVLEKSMDREEQEVHSLILTAEDGGNPVRSGTVRVQLNVIDANDNAPVFDQPVYNIRVLENVPKGSVLGTVRATDMDQGANSQVPTPLTNLRKMFHKSSNWILTLEKYLLIQIWILKNRNCMNLKSSGVMVFCHHIAKFS
ncbi:protocadherin gamma-A8-like [Ambystoma mexicanum]|uniref:protocadherin gamma-A8-like n=1 Tax=Ambystoma mexicanum TaxID=8296 RepID=UPI0037E7F746